MSDFRVFISRRLLPETLTRMQALFDIRYREEDSAMQRDAMLKEAAECDAMVVSLGDPLDAQFFEAIKSQNLRLKMIANFGAGVDHIDMQAAANAGILITNTPSVLAEDAADMAMWLILSLPRRMAEGVRALRDGKFEGWSPTWMLGQRLRGLNLGCIGLGRVGQAVAKKAKAFGLEVHYHSRQSINPHREEELAATYHADLDDMLRTVDIVSVHCPLTKETHMLLNADRLGQMKKGSYLVNVSRSEIVDEMALAKLIENGHIAGAGLDVFSKGADANPSLQAANNVLLMPHMASATVESRQDMGGRVLLNLHMFMNGETPPDRVIWDL